MAPTELFQNEQTYEQLLALIENNQGRLALIIVSCDDLRQRQRLIDRYELETAQTQIRAYRLTLGSEPSLRAGLVKLQEAEPHLQQGGEAVVTVTGAEWLLRVKLRGQDEQSDLDKFFGYLQWTREGLREFRYPIVLWVTSQILREIGWRAPDFWSWRKAVLRFVAEQTEPSTLGQYEPLPRTSELPSDQFLPPLAELLSEIQQLESTEPESPGLGTLYDKLGQVYAKRISQGQAANLEQETKLTIDAFEKAIECYQEINRQADLVNVLIALGIFFVSQSRYEEAIVAHQRSLEIACNIGDREGKAISLNNLGNVYYSLGQYQRAIDLHQQSLEIRQDIGNRMGEATSLNNLGNAYRLLGQYQRAIDFHQQSLEIRRDINNRNGEAGSLFSQALAFTKYEPQRSEALAGFQQARQIWAELQLDHMVEKCDEKIHDLNQSIATEDTEQDYDTGCKSDSGAMWV
jgi:tetratricopeptide (TPR) repeat protein